MNKNLQKLLNFLQSEDIAFSIDKASGFIDRDEPRLIFTELMPDRVCSYDTEIIDDIGAYRSVMQEHMQATLGEWAATDIDVSGELGKDVIIEFEHDGKKAEWKFLHDSNDYVSDDFYKKLNNWASRNLGGKFVALETYGQDVAFVYLPKKSASKVESFFDKTITANKFVQHFRSNEDLPSSFRDLRFDKSFDINCHDSIGDTALTAAIRAGNPQKALEALDEAIEADPLVKDKNGMSPLQLARQMDLPEVVEYLEGFAARKNKSLDELEKALYSETMHALINALKDLELSVEMYHSHRIGQWIDFGKTEVFEIGIDTLTVKPYFKPGVYQEHGTYTVTSMPNSEVGTSQENVSLKETLGLIEQFYK